MKVPGGRGTWPAFWMLGSNIDQMGWPACGEIDVMEHVGCDPGTVHGTLHAPGYSGLAVGLVARIRPAPTSSETFTPTASTGTMMKSPGCSTEIPTTD